MFIIQRPPLTAYHPGRMGKMSLLETRARWQNDLIAKIQNNKKGSVSHLKLVHTEGDGEE